jgi:hypothetical protein
MGKSQIKLAQKEAKKHYEFLIEAYEKIKEKEAFKYTTHGDTSRNMIKAQIKIHAGIYNRNYGEYKEGLDKYKSNANDVIEGRMLIIKNGQIDTEYTNFNKIEYMQLRVKHYESLYEQLPRNYFITN